MGFSTDCTVHFCVLLIGKLTHWFCQEFPACSESRFQECCTRFSLLIKNNGIKQEKIGYQSVFKESGFVGQNISILYLSPPFALGFQIDF